VRHLLRIRAANTIFRRRDFLHGLHPGEGRFKDVAWLGPDGHELTQDQWHDPSLKAFAMLLDGTSVSSAREGSESSDNFLVLFNPGMHKVEFTLPAPISSAYWEVTLDSSQDAGAVPAGSYRQGHRYRLARHALALLVDRD